MDNPRNLPAVRQNAALALPTTGEIDSMLKMADLLVSSGMVPSHLKTPQQAFYALQKGRELGIPPTNALSNIIVVQGKPTANAELMAALIYRDHGDDALRVVESTVEVCTIEYKRATWRRAERYTFSIEDARRANLLKNPTWNAYPQAMLRARAISAVARMAFQDSIGGMFTPEELGARVTLNDDGDVVSVDVPTEPRRYDANGERQPEPTQPAPAPRPPARNGHGGRAQAQRAAGVAAMATAEREPVRVVTGGYRPSDVHCMAFRDGHPCGGKLEPAGGKSADDILTAARSKGLPDDVTLCNGCLTAWREAGFGLARVEAASPVDGLFTEVDEPAAEEAF